MKPYWIINQHTRACFGPYESILEARYEIANSTHPEDWLIVEKVKARS